MTEFVFSPPLRLFPSVTVQTLSDAAAYVRSRPQVRLTILSKSLRESRRCRKLAEMYWALALGEKPEAEGIQPSKMIVKTSPT